VPPSVAVPVTLVRSAALPETSTRYAAALAITRLPCTVNVPIELPGASVPPLLIAAEPTVPLPPSVPPAFTVVRIDVAIEPFTSNVPALTVVAPV
jgi:hypothetical protein